MARCWGCCQENCGYAYCDCFCHEENVLKKEGTKKIDLNVQLQEDGSFSFDKKTLMKASIKDCMDDVKKRIAKKPKQLGPREDFFNADECFMGIALLMAQRSKDPNTQVGACIVDQKNRIKATGYNGFPRDIPSDKLPWDREGEFLKTKYAYVCHAEENAIYNRDSNSLEGCKIYCTLYPCNECTKAIIQSGIKEVVYLNKKYANTDSVKASEKMFGMTNIILRRFRSSKEFLIKF